MTRTLQKTSGYERAVVINDLHIPFHDKKAIAVMLKFLAWLKPEKVFINGDLLDCQTAGRYVNDPFLEVSLTEEIQQGRDFLRTLRSVIGKTAKVYYIHGNHEYRFQSYIIANARALRGLEGLSLHEQLHCDEYGVETISSGLKESYMQYGDLYIGHYNKVAKHGGYTVKSLVDDKGVSVVQGHTHRFGTHFRTLLNGQVLGGYENGCLCDMNPTYTMKPNWQQGFCVVHKDKKTDHCVVEPLQMQNHSFFYGGVLWK